MDGRSTIPAKTASPPLEGGAPGAVEPNNQTVTLCQDQPLVLDSGDELGPIQVAYQTVGSLNADKSNVILICHALTGDHYVVGTHPVTGKPGWWGDLVGPGKVIDTNRWFIVCSNVLGGCQGTTGPKDINPATGKPWGLDFPVITIRDMVNVQALLLNHLGIERVFCAIGGSMGAMQVLQWSQSYPERIFSAVPIAGSWRHSAQNIAFHEVGRQAIMADPDWHGGTYIEAETKPERGLAVARMTAHITYLSETALHKKFGRRLQNRDKVAFGFDADFQVESYLRHQGASFVKRFDANSYLYITRAMDYFDLSEKGGGSLAQSFQGISTRFCLVSFSSDWLFPTAESRDIVRAMSATAANVSFVEVHSDKGHDAFLLDEPEFHETLSGFLDGAARLYGAPDLSDNPDQGQAATSAGPKTAKPLRDDLKLIADLVAPKSRVLDVGCDTGDLLYHLIRSKQVDGRGIELSMEGVRAGVAKGVAVIQGDADTDLFDYPDNAFDYVLLSQTLQATRQPREVLDNLTRIGRRAIVSLPNFGHWRSRLSFLLRGRMPETSTIPHHWWDTPNIHLCTVKDFLYLCEDMGLKVERALTLDEASRPSRRAADSLLSNLLGAQAVFVISRPDGTDG